MNRGPVDYTVHESPCSGNATEDSLDGGPPHKEYPLRLDIVCPVIAPSRSPLGVTSRLKGGEKELSPDQSLLG